MGCLETKLVKISKKVISVAKKEIPKIHTMFERIFGSLNKQRKRESSLENQEFLLDNQTADSQTQS